MVSLSLSRAQTSFYKTQFELLAAKQSVSMNFLIAPMKLHPRKHKPATLQAQNRSNCFKMLKMLKYEISTAN